jgi:restriction endonuclease S subunit
LHGEWKIFIADNLTNGLGFGSTEFHVLRPRSTNVLPGYIFAFMAQSHLRKVARLAFTGSAGHQRVPSDFVSNLPFPVSPIAVQQRIVLELEKRRERVRQLELDAPNVIAALKQRMDAIERMRNRVAHNRRPSKRIRENYDNALPLDLRWLIAPNSRSAPSGAACG